MMPLDLAPGEAWSEQPDGAPGMFDRADPKTIEAWIITVASVGLPNTPSDTVFAARLPLYLLVLEDLPAVCWTEATLKFVLGIYRFWPTPAELKQTLEGVAHRLRLEYYKAGEIPEPPPRPPPPTRESSIPYKLPSPPPMRTPRWLRRVDGDQKADLTHIDLRARDAQLAALGYPRPPAKHRQEDAGVDKPVPASA
jgi:hypothetical protein